ncbi:MAG: hypothetical protein RBU37_27295, partial [Myxococcota bacterium]|nr:hypothetical protein [Myxococcota bacterium]
QAFELVQHRDDKLRLAVSLAELYRDKLADRARASRCLVRAIELDPSREDVIDALIGLGTDTVRVSEDQLDRAIAVQSDSLRDDPWRIGAYSQLYRLLALRDPQDVRLEPILRLLHFFGRAPQNVDPSAHPLNRHRPSEATCRRFLLHPWARGVLFELFVPMSDALAQLLLASGELLSAQTPVWRPSPDEGVSVLFAELCGRLAISGVELYVASKLDTALSWTVQPWRALWLSENWASLAGERGGQQRLRYWLGHGLEGMRDAKAAVGLLSPDDFEHLLRACVARLFPDLPVRGSATQETAQTQQLAEAMAQAIPRRTRRELRALAEAAVKSSWHLPRWSLGLRFTMNRAGLLAAERIDVALEELMAVQGISQSLRAEARLEQCRSVAAIGDLLEFVVSDDYVALCDPRRGG